MVRIRLQDVIFEFFWRCPIAEDFFGDNLIQQWSVTAGLSDDNGAIGELVGRWEIVILPWMSLDDPVDCLDAISGDMAHFASLFEDGELREELEALGDRIMIIDRAEITQAHRGHGLGAILTGMVIERLSGGVSHAAFFPHPLQQIESAAELAAARQKVERVWASIGAAPVESEIWLINLNMSRMRDNLSELRIVYESTLTS